MAKTEPMPESRPQEFSKQPAGSFASWLGGVKRARKLRVLGNEVPCGECVACCRASMFIHVRPEETDTLQHIPKPLLFPAPGAPKGHVLLGFNERGECPMLRDGRCSIYDHRPQTCRDFDCRVLAATGVVPEADGPQGELARRARSWRFDLAGHEEREQYAAVQAAGAFLREQRDAFPGDALPHQPVQLAALALHVHELFVAHEREPAATRSVGETVREVLARMEPREPR